MAAVTDVAIDVLLLLFALTAGLGCLMVITVLVVTIRDEWRAWRYPYGYKDMRAKRRGGR